MAGDPLTERLKEQVSASIQDALSKATSVLSNLHRVQSYLDVLASLPVSRAGDVIKNAVEQVKGMRADAATLLQTVYLTEIGLQSLQVQCVHINLLMLISMVNLSFVCRSLTKVVEGSLERDCQVTRTMSHLCRLN